MGILANMTRERKMVSKGEVNYTFRLQIFFLTHYKFVFFPLLSRSSMSVRLISELMFFRLKIPLLTNCIKKEKKKCGYFSGPLLFQVDQLVIKGAFYSPFPSYKAS